MKKSFPRCLLVAAVLTTCMVNTVYTGAEVIDTPVNQVSYTSTPEENTHVTSSGSLTVTGDSKFDGGHSDVHGGGLHNEGSVSLNDATFTNNQAPTFIENNTFAAGLGGAIYNAANAQITISGDAVFGKGQINADGSVTTSNGNYSQMHGGAIYNAGVINITGDNTIFAGNTSEYVGGAISNNGTIEIGNNAQFIGNIAEGLPESVSSDRGGQGGAIHNQGGTITIGEGSKFYGNEAHGYAGGAIYQDNNADVGSSSLTIGNNAEFVGNKSKPRRCYHEL